MKHVYLTATEILSLLETGEVTVTRPDVSPRKLRPRPGDELWVREPFCLCESGTFGDGETETKVFYRVTDNVDYVDDGDGYAVRNKDGSEASPWLSPARMRREQSRLSVRVGLAGWDFLRNLHRREDMKSAYSLHAWDNNRQVWCFSLRRIPQPQHPAIVDIARTGL